MIFKIALLVVEDSILEDFPENAVVLLAMKTILNHRLVLTNRNCITG